MRNLGILALLLPLSMPSFSYECGESAFYSTRKENGQRIGLFASAKTFSDAPVWELGKGEPPLSVHEAVTKIKEWSSSFYSRFDSVSVDSVTIQRFGCWEARRNWLYVFSLSPVIDGNQLHGSGYMAAMTMSGKVIEPREYE